MIRHVVRGATAVAGAAVMAGVLAGPAAAEDILPSGCAGSSVYVCTGPATPPGGWDMELANVPLAKDGIGVFVPGMTVGGQHVGGTVVLFGGTTTPGVSTAVGGPVEPVDTGVASPVNLCLFVTCLAQGAPIVIPGADLPYVPVTVAPRTVPAVAVTTPTDLVVPTYTTQPAQTPTIDLELTTLHVYEAVSPLGTGAGPRLQAAGVLVCQSTGGEVESWGGEYSCYPHVIGTDRVANLLFLAARLV